MKPLWFFVAAALLAVLYRRRGRLEITLKVGGVLVAISFVAAVTVAVLRALARAGVRVALVTAALAVAVLVGLSRIQLRTQDFSDVGAGWGLGATMFTLCGMVALVVVSFRHNPRVSA
jgi:hypothetical protein